MSRKSPQTDQLQAAVHQSPPPPGQVWPGQGGVYVGVMRAAPGKEPYHLIVAAGIAGVAFNVAWGSERIIKGADCEWDGLANTMVLAKSRNKYPAARFCATLEIEGHHDWYLPSRRELALCYANAPDQFEPRWHWSSTQGSANHAWGQYFDYGSQLNGRKSYEGRARAVRRFPIQSFSPLALAGEVAA